MDIIVTNCFCGSELIFEQCCQPIISGELNANNAEALMRSRFTAYFIKDYQYILHSYASKQRTKLTVSELESSTLDTQWLSLQVLAHHPRGDNAQVEFKACYQLNNAYYVMHELSNFVFEAGKWLYTNGTMQKDTGEFTPQRNSQCLCNSGKKFKKCCGK